MNDELFGGMRPAAAPPELRDRVLGAASATAGRRERGRREGVSFTRFDLAWVAALLLLLAGNLLLSGRGRSDLVAAAGERPAAAAMGRDRADRQLARELGVSPSLVVAGRTQSRPNAGEELRRLLNDPAFEWL